MILHFTEDGTRALTKTRHVPSSTRRVPSSTRRSIVGGFEDLADCRGRS